MRGLAPFLASVWISSLLADVVRDAYRAHGVGAALLSLVGAMVAVEIGKAIWEAMRDD